MHCPKWLDPVLLLLLIVVTLITTDITYHYYCKATHSWLGFRSGTYMAAAALLINIGLLMVYVVFLILKKNRNRYYLN